jgi:hypothetical protein
MDLFICPVKAFRFTLLYLIFRESRVEIKYQFSGSRTFTDQRVMNEMPLTAEQMLCNVFVYSIATCALIRLNIKTVHCYTVKIIEKLKII